jgi:hypothetical protein
MVKPKAATAAEPGAVVVAILEVKVGLWSVVMQVDSQDNVEEIFRFLVQAQELIVRITNQDIREEEPVVAVMDKMEEFCY